MTDYEKYNSLSNNQSGSTDERTVSYYYHPDYSNPSGGPSTEPPKKKAKSPRRFSGRVLAVCLAVCMVFSGGLGFWGGVTALQNQPTVSDSDNTSKTPVTPTAVTSGDSLSVSQIAALAADSVVEIVTESTTNVWDRQYTSEGAGSGVIISSDGYIITNNHVVEGATKVTIRLRNGESYNGTVLGTDSETDIALVKIDASGLTAATIGDSDALVVGELAVAIGNPLGELGGTVTDGIISALDREIILEGQTMNLLQTNAAINPGNSGGGLFNGRGELIGIVVAKSTGTNVEGLGFAIPINDVKDVIENLKDYGYVRGRVELGVTVVTITTQQQAAYYRVNEPGVYIQSVVSGSDAERAGLQSGDKIVKVNDSDLESGADLADLIENASVGDSIKLEIQRNGQNQIFTITLTEKGAAN
ncbi:S1C family serine protease [Feifania hominis]|uniref:Trypsin-like peptidase domain-containing protein n=1 Tax=Feifania hominis TaxID=2763660 RepID=A0A926HV78_9FIRM|nr:trypsin-like peptidase domain-containing protein [Feifania hominis]MBC8536331.1 trypsin-like peptidase domain-containing protein [Feifania hominis]